MVMFPPGTGTKILKQSYATYFHQSFQRFIFILSFLSSGLGFRLIIIIMVLVFTRMQKFVVERISRHMLQGMILLEVEVRMPPEMMIR